MYTGETKNDLKLKIAQKACKHIKPSKSTSPSNTVVLFALNIEGLRTSGHRLIKKKKKKALIDSKDSETSMPELRQ